MKRFFEVLNEAKIGTFDIFEDNENELETLKMLSSFGIGSNDAKPLRTIKTPILSDETKGLINGIGIDRLTAYLNDVLNPMLRTESISLSGTKVQPRLLGVGSPTMISFGNEESTLSVEPQELEGIDGTDDVYDASSALKEPKPESFNHSTDFNFEDKEMDEFQTALQVPSFDRNVRNVSDQVEANEVPAFDAHFDELDKDATFDAHFDDLEQFKGAEESREAPAFNADFGDTKNQMDAKNGMEAPPFEADFSNLVCSLSSSVK